MIKHKLPILILLLILSLACGAAPRAATQPAVESPAPVISPLTLEQIQNAQYPIQAREDHSVVQLSGGKYQQGTDSSDVNFAYIAVTQFVAFGDLTGDGVEEAAVIFLENFGGTGNFSILAVYANVNGLPVFLHAAFIDDRPLINALSIENGEIFLDAVIHGFEDGGCCPQLPSTRRYILAQNKLRLTNYTTAAPNGTKREIEILTPANGAEASGSILLNGSVSIAPFENNLSYFIYDEAGNQLSAGPVPVTAPDFGAPGTFAVDVPLAGLPAGSAIYIEIQDQSAADGSLLAMDVIKIIVK